MNTQILSSNLTIVDGKAVIDEQTQKTYTPTELNNLIIQEKRRKVDIENQMYMLKSEYLLSDANIARYLQILIQLTPTTPDTLPTV